MIIRLPKPPSLNSLYRYTYKNGKSWLYMTAKGREWLEEAGWELKQQCPHRKPLQGQISIYIKLYHCGRYDYDNALKITNDLLTKMEVIKDDNQITFAQIEKIKVSKRKMEKIEIEIEV